MSPSLEDEGSGSSTSPTKYEQQGDREDNGTAARQPPRKRRRIVISCSECHRRKQKCDRKLPCTNCVTRNKPDSCRYETGAPTAKEQHKAHEVSLEHAKRGPEDTIPAKINFGYSATGASTLGFLKKIDGANPEEPLSRLAMGRDDNGDQFGTRERYKSLIRQLPARSYIEKLVDIYFRDFNWQYYGVEQDVFEKQLEEWYSMPFGLLNTGGPHALPPDLRAFPALVFQLIATALLNLPPGPDPTFDSLKYAGTMTFEDLALDYSESGVAILSLLGKRQVSLTTVVTGFLRAAFLKYSGLVTEAWHAIGSAIRDAQECGLHRDSLDPKPYSTDAEAGLENQWEIQRRRKAWILLISWDLHTGIVLGRPTILSSDAHYTMPVDAPIPKNYKDRRTTPVAPRGENDPPTPLTRALWAYECMKPLRDILDLEKEGQCPKDFSKVDHIHQDLLDLEARTPAYFRIENPDTRYDDLPECYWVPLVRATLPQLMSFNFMALHRPYVFTRPHSRKEALKASFDMLRAQREHFASLSPQQYKTFSLFFGTFDAIVLMACIFILFPKENTENGSLGLQHFHWAVERFETMSERNSLAKAALGALHAIYIRLKKCLGLGFVNASKTAMPVKEAPASASLDGIDPALADVSAIPSGSISRPSTMTPISGASDMYSAPPSSATTDWTLPDDFDWSSIQPVYAMADIAYNDLMGISAARDESSMPNWAGGTPIINEVADGSQPWQFGGDFGSDSVWNVLNQYTPF